MTAVADSGVGDGALVSVESDEVRLVLEGATGDLVEFTDLVHSWTIAAGTGSLIEIQVPDDDQSAVFLRPHGRPDLLRRDRGALSFTWSHFQEEEGRTVPIACTLHLDVVGQEVTFMAELVNGSERMLESVRLPRITGMRPRGKAPFVALMKYYFGAVEHKLWPRFEANKEYYGTEKPTLHALHPDTGSPTAPWVLLHDGEVGLLAAVEASTDVTSWSIELDPGYADMLGRTVVAQIPGREPSSLTFTAEHLPFAGPGESVRLPAISLAVTDGGWRKGLQPYARRRSHEPGPANPPDWFSRPHSWFQVQMGSPMGERRYHFSELPKLARDCKRHKVDVLHLIGWNAGGQDRGNPSHEPDPALGGAEALRQAIRECEDLGVRVVLFAKFTWADRTTDWYRSELWKLAALDAYGDPYVGVGWQYSTPGSFLDVTVRRLVPMCFLADEWMAICESEFDRMLDLGPSGILYDEAMHHTPALLCFSERHGHRPGASIFGRDLELAQRLRRRASDRGMDDFLLIGESLYDGLVPGYQGSYIRSYDDPHIPVQRLINPKLPMITTVTGLDDRNQLNQTLVYGYISMLEPRHFKGRLDEFPATMSHLSVVEGVRSELDQWLWHGQLVWDSSAAVSRDGIAHDPYGVWRGSDGSHVIVVANYESESIGVDVLMPDGLAPQESLIVDEGASWQPMTTTQIVVPPRTAVVVR